MTNSERTIPDAQARRLAETTFDRNVVVVAGAGTGKTTLLVNRLIHVLMREPKPAPITQIVALTFTNKAATEMKVRLRERLLGLLSPEPDDSGRADPGAVNAAGLRERYGLSSDQIAARAQAALHDLEKAQIGTLHSFAAHLLRLYPIESGVDPNFAEDDGLRFADLFATQWDLWLDRELGPNGSNHGRWRRFLSEVGLGQLRDLADSLCSGVVPLDELARQIQDGKLALPLQEWLAAKRTRAATLLAAHDRQKRRKAESMLAAAQELFGLVVERGLDGIRGLSDDAREQIGKNPGTSPAGWSEEDFAEAGGFIRTAKRLLAVDHEVLRDLLSVLLPFVTQVRATFLQEGWISFDGLLAGARALLRDHPAIRERLKQDYLAVLVDEFQDTDPIQYEIILYLTERPGRCATAWRDVDLTAGKLFIVGDPKQSIYAFRRADIEAFEEVVKKIQTSGGVVYALETNFRSHGAVLSVVNGVFDRLLSPQPALQPPNVPLAVRPNRQGGVTRPGVELRLVEAEDNAEELDAAAATRLEAETLARWLKDDLLARERLTDAMGRSVPLKPGHVALLFRKLTQAQDYLDALRRHEIPYVTDGEKHFYRRQEVIDLVNLLRVVENPHDTVALVGVLRSPLGGLTDREIYELRGQGALDYRRADCIRAWASPRADAVCRLYEKLENLYRTAGGCPLPDTVELLFARLPILELAAASLHGEQAVANLNKVRQMAVELADRPHLTLTGFVELMIDRLSEQPEEAESALAEESPEAVRVLTIHKAKGLEFPVVILPGLHHGGKAGRGDPPVSHDWSTGVWGLSLGDHCSLGAVLVNEKSRAREDAERRRLLYVGMTRARERLILSGGLPGRTTPGAFLALLQEAADDELGQPEQSAVQVGSISFNQTVEAASERIPRSRRPALAELRPPPDWTQLVLRWEQRDQAWSEACSTPRFLSPSLLMQREPPMPRRLQRAGVDAERARLVGVLAHRVLEGWDFGSDPAKLGERVGIVCRQGVPPEWGEAITEEIAEELHRMFQAFVASEPYTMLRRAEVLGREVPFAIPWQGADTQPCVMEGVIDLLYRLDGQVWIADYKTDRVEDDEVASRAGGYRVQADVYRRAVSRCLGVEPVGFQFVFLRNGLTVPL